MARVWVNSDEDEEGPVEVPFQSIVDRTEDTMCFALETNKHIWILNEFIGKIDEMRGVVEVEREFAEENKLI